MTLADVNELEGFDGIMFGVSARYGGIPAQMKTIMDATGGLWQNGKLVGKTAGVFQSTGTMQGGQESVAMNCMSFFAHQGMVFILLGYIDPKAFFMKKSMEDLLGKWDLCRTGWFEAAYLHGIVHCRESWKTLCQIDCKDFCIKIGSFNLTSHSTVIGQIKPTAHQYRKE